MIRPFLFILMISASLISSLKNFKYTALQRVNVIKRYQSDWDALFGEDDGQKKPTTPAPVKQTRPPAKRLSSENRVDRKPAWGNERERRPTGDWGSNGQRESGTREGGGERRSQWGAGRESSGGESRRPASFSSSSSSSSQWGSGSENRSGVQRSPRPQRDDWGGDDRSSSSGRDYTAARRGPPPPLRAQQSEWGARQGGGQQQQAQGGGEARPRWQAGASSSGGGGGWGGGGGERSRSYGGDRGSFQQQQQQQTLRPRFGTGAPSRAPPAEFDSEDRERDGRSDWEESRPDREPVYGIYEGDHIYGVSPVRTAIGGSRRNITELLMQEGMDLSIKKDEKLAKEIVQIAKEKSIPIRKFSKHDLNMMTDSRPHQGFVLRAKELEFIKIEELEPTSEFKCVLALDEVWDPQNFGALLRTAHFLACDKVVVCAKNSAPLSPVVSKASSGAMELMDVYSASNMMKFLDKSKENGWQVVGTSLAENAIDLNQAVFDKPTILVLGNEGYGMRTNVIRRCDTLVKIAGLGESSSGVDSLNVSVTGGILLYNILSSGKMNKAA